MTPGTTPAPAAVPSEDDVKTVLETVGSFISTNDGFASIANAAETDRAVIALFARVLEEKERVERENAKLGRMLAEKAVYAASKRAVEAEEALAEERATIERLHRRVIRKHLREMKAAGQPNVVDPEPRPPEPGGEAGLDRPLRPFR